MIKTTVVGSYPVPSWLVGNTSRVVLRDAIMTVLKTQELAGLDVISDGELQRFDPGHPETNGMIDYFVSQMEGIQTRFSKADLDRFRSDQALQYRAAPAGLVLSKVGSGTLNLRNDYQLARALTRPPAQVHLHRAAYAFEGFDQQLLSRPGRAGHGHRGSAARPAGADRCRGGAAR